MLHVTRGLSQSKVRAGVMGRRIRNLSGTRHQNRTVCGVLSCDEMRLEYSKSCCCYHVVLLSYDGGKLAPWEGSKYWNCTQ